MRATGADPLWRSAAVRAGLLWLGTTFAAGVGAVAWSDHEARGTTNARLDVLTEQVAGLRRDLERMLPITARKDALP